MSHTATALRKEALPSDTTVNDFWTRQATLPIPHARPITCLVCKREGASNAAHPELCDLCGADLPAARAFVTTMVLRCELRVEQTMEAYYGSHNTASPALLGRLSAYHDARMAGDLRAEAADLLARSGRADPLLNLVRLWLDCQDAGERYAEVQAWAQRCEAVL